MSDRNTIVRSENQIRLPWVDFSRGVCMLLVVMMHFDEMHFANLTLDTNVQKLWDAISSAARPARMPTFFLISGFLASGSLSKQWNLVWHKRVGLLYYLYIIWGIIFVTVLYILFREPSLDTAKDYIQSIISAIIFPNNQIWFLYSLAIFFIITKIFYKLKLIIIFSTLIFSCFFSYIDNMVLSESIRCLPFYIFGAYYPDVIKDIGGKCKIFNIFVIIFAYSISVIPIMFLSKDFPGIWIPSSIVGIFLILKLSVYLSETFFSHFIIYIGKNTLPIYVMHGFLILIINQIVLHNFRNTIETSNILFQITYPIMGIITVIIATLSIFILLNRSGAKWMFNLPPVVQNAASKILFRNG